MSLSVSWKRSSSFFGSLAMLASNVRYGSRVRSAYGSGSNGPPSLKPRDMRSCNVRVLPNPRVTLWFRVECAAPSARHCFQGTKNVAGQSHIVSRFFKRVLLVDHERDMLK